MIVKEYHYKRALSDVYPVKERCIFVLWGSMMGE